MACKTFYDSVLHYDEIEEEANKNPETDHPWPDGNVGWMVVLCRECAETYRVETMKLGKALAGE